MRKARISPRRKKATNSTGTDSANMAKRNWHGYYWARRTEEGDYEIRTVPSSLGEASASGGVFPKRGFEGHYEKVDT